MQELSGSTPTANLLTGLGIDEVFTRTLSGGTETILAEALGSTLALADGSGDVDTEYTWNARQQLTGLLTNALLRFRTARRAMATAAAFARHERAALAQRLF